LIILSLQYVPVSHRPEVKVERIDAENEEAVKRLVDLHMQSAKNTMSVSELIAKNKTAADQRRQDAGESEGDSDVEKEIKRLSKLNILLNRNKSAIQRSKPKKKGKVLPVKVIQLYVDRGADICCTTNETIIILHNMFARATNLPSYVMLFIL